MKISIAIPTYKMLPDGDKFFRHSLEIIEKQTYKDIEVCVSDHCDDNFISDVVHEFRHRLDIKYFRKDYNATCPSDNMNIAMSLCSGEYIKLLFQDDYLYGVDAIEKTVCALEANRGCNWLVSACEHSYDGVTVNRAFYPAWNDDMLKGVNTISSPSVVTVKNDSDRLFFDESLIWLMDCEYYYRLHRKFGLPVILNDITVVNRLWQNQLTNTLSDEKKNAEFDYIKTKYTV